MTKRLHIVPAFAAVLALTGAPAMAAADHRHHDHGLYVKLGDRGGFTLGYSRRHAVLNHYQAYRRIERQLSEKREKLMRRTRRALQDEDFDRTTRLLARLVVVDQKLDEHRDHHRGCNH